VNVRIITITNKDKVMTEPRVELKRVKFFRGNEGYGLNADIWINGIKCLFAIDSANGGCMDYDRYGNTEVVKANVKLLEDYIASLPKDEDGFAIEMDEYINNVHLKQEEAKLKIKNEKKMLKLFETAIVFGIVDENKYRYLQYNKPLKEFDTNNLQTIVNTAVKKFCVDGVVILNTNLKQLGITV
jgi:hypothetical protein